MAKQEVKEGGQGGAMGSGTDSLEIRQEGHDPNAARKALFARYSQVSQATREQDIKDTPGAAELQAGYEQGELATTDDGDAGENAIQPPREAAPAPAPAPSPAPRTVVDSAPSPSPPEMVELTVFGQTVHKPKAEVDAAGGALAMQLKLAAEHRVAQAVELGRKAAEASRNVLDKDRILAEKLRDVTTGVAPSATPAAKPNPAPAVTDVASAAKQIVEGLWTGKPEIAEKEVSDALAKMLAGGVQPAQLDPNKIAELVMAKVDRDLAVRDVKQLREEERQAVNELMRSDRFKPIMENAAIKAGTYALFQTALKDTRNQGRSQVEIANEIGSGVLASLGAQASAPQVRQAEVAAEVNTRTNFKRRLPQASNASERAPAAAQEKPFPTKPSDVVEMYRAARGQQPMR